MLARAPFVGPATASLHGKRAGGGAWVAVAALRARRWPKMKEIWVRLLVPHLPKSCASFESRKTGEKGVCLIWTPPVPHEYLRITRPIKLWSKNAYIIRDLRESWFLEVGFALGLEFYGSDRPWAKTGLFSLFWKIFVIGQTFFN